MKFLNYYSLLSPEDKKNLAKRLGTSTAYLYQIATGRRNAGRKILKNIFQATDQVITAEDLLSDEAA